jgi:hypothetical protein
MRNGLHLVVAICCPEFIAQETFMRIVWTALFTVIFLGSTMKLGWCPQPAQATASYGRSNGATPFATDPRPLPPRTLTPKEMTPHQRSSILSREVGAGRVKGKEEIRNFIATGDPKTPPPPPAPPKYQLPATKPGGMSQATWARIQATPGWQRQYGNTAMDRLQGTQ